MLCWGALRQRCVLSQFTSLAVYPAFRGCESGKQMHSGGRVSKVAGFNPPDEGRPHIAGWLVNAHCLSALLREELESLLDELLVELEDSAVAGVRVDHQLVVRQTSGHVEGVRRRQHPVVIAVREEHGLADE